MSEEIEGEWYLVDGVAVYWDGAKNRRFKWKADPEEFVSTTFDISTRQNFCD
jgi:hypothetical protein